jgi:asparagine synthase (glutamine-hydrolysing)
MCGILGATGEIRAISSAAFANALDTIAHRGPDAHAVWRDALACFGHRRLAIIDLSDAGTQPMVDPDTGLVITFNGEIYNFVELRTELVAKGHRFRTASDTEVLLKGYIEWGAGILARCNGMWAFAIWDPRKETLFLARDRFGKKPLYYASGKQRLLFASEPKALHALDPSLAEADPAALVELVINSRLHAGQRTFYRNILALPAAHYATYDTNRHRVTLQRYWDYPIPAEGRASATDDDQRFNELFIEAVSLRHRSDVPVGLTLSGGLDSSSILAAGRSVDGASSRCYTSVYSRDQRGEEHWAHIAAKYAGTSVTPVEASFEDWWPTLGKIVQQMDGPGFSPAVLPLWHLMARARRDGVPVLLEGQGADELLAGYPQYAAVYTLGHLKAGRVASFAVAVNQMRQSFSSKMSAAWLTREAFPKVVGHATRDRRLPIFHPEHLRDWRDRAPDTTLSTVGKSYDPLRAALWRDHAIDVLPALLHYGDAISMAHGVESRLPFMDYRLVEWVFRDRPSLLDGGQTKSLVRNFLRRQRFDAIAERKDKLGYPVPLLEWFRTIGRRHLQETISDANAPIWDVMSKPEIVKLAKATESGSATGVFHLYKVLTTDVWLRQLSQRAALKQAA